jgi:hypothetical protein
MPYYRLDGTVYGSSLGSPGDNGLPAWVDVATLPAGTDWQHGRFELTVSTEAPAESLVDRTESFTVTGEGGLPSLL